MMNVKTNVMRILDKAGIVYQSNCYEGAVSGEEVAAALGQNPAMVFKTLVTQGKSGRHYVFVIPVNRELDLKKAAAAAGEKSVAMIKSKELLPLTGYIHGGCSPIGMKKTFPTYIDISASEFTSIMFSGGKIGLQLEVNPDDIQSIIPFTYESLV